MRAMKNEFHVKGYLYQHSLTKKVSGPNSANPGTEYINGEIEIATDDAMLNIVKVYYPYVTQKTKSGAENASFATLNNIINGTFGSVMGNGPDKAVKLRVDTSLALNEFYSDRNGQTELVSVPRNEGGFIHVLPSLPPEIEVDKNGREIHNRNEFVCDIVITGTKHLDENEETRVPEKTLVNGYIFNFRKAVMPFTFIVTDPGAMNYYEGLEATEKNPVFTGIKGLQVSTVVTREIVEDSAFGAPSIRTITTPRREYAINWGAAEPYEFDDPSTITREELTAAIAEREVYLASLKNRRDEAIAAKAAASAVPAAPVSSGFNF